MSRYDYSEIEQQINNVLVYHEKKLAAINFPDMTSVDTRISESEKLLQSLGYELPVTNTHKSNLKSILLVPSWRTLCLEAEAAVGSQCELESIFTEEELAQNTAVINKMNDEFSMLHHLDKYDVAISVIAGIASAAVDILMCGIPQKTPSGICAGKLSDYIRTAFEKRFPEAEMQKVANDCKVPYDAQDNRHTKVHVEGLSAYYHRLLSLGHDPLLGFIVGVFDIMNGRMTTIDKRGKFVSQGMECNTERMELSIFSAIAKQLLHLKSDITTSMGLPIPLMGLFSKLQIGAIGESEQTIAEIVQGMYYEGYDFIHFCSMTIPVMIIEVIVRLGYALKRINEGHCVKDSVPVSLDTHKHPKLATMLFIAHSCATAVNAGKVYFTENPLAINYPQWLAFAKYSFSQLKWHLFQKPELQERYVNGKLYEEFSAMIWDVDKTFDEISKQYIVVFE